MRRCEILGILFCLFALLSCMSSPSFALADRVLAITIDDPHTLETPLLDPVRRDERIRAALQKHQAQAVLFVCGKRVDDPAGTRLLESWNSDGHLMANHSYSHNSLNSKKVTLDQYSDDYDKGQAIVARFVSGFNFYRFPYLKEGNSIAKRDGFRDFLRSRGAQIGYVTIDASDWAIDDRLRKRLSDDPSASLEAYKNFYLKHITDRANFYESLARRSLGFEVPHVLLLHHNLLAALFLDDLLFELKKQGWSIEKPQQVYSHSVYQREPKTLPAGESLIWALAKESGKFDAELRYPGEDEIYERDAMDKAGL
jgi:peptidoglycan-N-acetylglucosamine deacetylase